MEIDHVALGRTDEGTHEVTVLYEDNWPVAASGHEFTDRKKAIKLAARLKRWMEHGQGEIPFHREVEFFGGPACGRKASIVGVALLVPLVIDFTWKGGEYSYRCDCIPSSGRLQFWTVGG